MQITIQLDTSNVDSLRDVKRLIEFYLDKEVEDITQEVKEVLEEVKNETSENETHESREIPAKEESTSIDTTIEELREHVKVLAKELAKRGLREQVKDIVTQYADKISNVPEEFLYPLKADLEDLKDK